MPKSIDINEPQVGYYRRRLVRRGMWVAARIWWEYGEVDEESGHKMADDVLHCLVNGKKRNPYTEWLWLAKEPITEAEYRFMVDDTVHAEEHRPDDPKAHPEKPIDVSKMKSIF